MKLLPTSIAWLMVAVVACATAVIVTTTDGGRRVAGSWYPVRSSAAPLSAAQAGDGDALRVAFVGDSYTTGAGLVPSQRDVRWTRLVAQSFGWEELNFGLGGTGYSTATIARGCGAAQCPSYRERVDDVAAARPDMVIISGGRNDKRNFDPADADALLVELRKAVGADVPLVVLEPFYDDGPRPQYLKTTASELQRIAADHEALYVALPHTLGGKPELIHPDGIHPNVRGYRELADDVATALHHADIGQT